MTKAEWFREKHPELTDETKIIPDEAYDAGFEAAKDMAARPTQKSKEAVESALKIYTKALDPCPACRKNGKEIKTCQQCCFFYDSKFEM